VATCGRVPDTGIVWISLETHEEAVTQLPSGELRAGGVKAPRPRADHARGRSEATSLARGRAQLRGEGVIPKWGLGHVWQHPTFEVPESYGDVIRTFKKVERESASAWFVDYATVW
jgi:hypothetical protein